ncbi:hypothetical protein LC593_02030 [Nostoc sp. CHAB 5844]|nr:hypothetical protein [Nostoc sp. CHAB 5844]
MFVNFWEGNEVCYYSANLALTVIQSKEKRALTIFAAIAKQDDFTTILNSDRHKLTLYLAINNIL